MFLFFSNQGFLYKIATEVFKLKNILPEKSGKIHKRDISVHGKTNRRTALLSA